MQAWRPRHRQNRRRITAQIRAIRLGRTLSAVSARNCPAMRSPRSCRRRWRRPTWTTSGSVSSCRTGRARCPLPLIMRAAHEALAGRAKEVTVLIALGTHQSQSEEQLAQHLGYEPGGPEEPIPAGGS